MKLKSSRPGIAGTVDKVDVGSKFTTKVQVGRCIRFITVKVVDTNTKYGVHAFHLQNTVEVGPTHYKYDCWLAKHMLKLHMKEKKLVLLKY